MSTESGVGRFAVLMVCTGNICRSPFAEILARHLLIGRLGGREAATIDVSSAGVQAVVGGAVHPLTRAELAPWRLDAAAERFRARQLTAGLLTDADLVLTASTRHRAAVAQLLPAARGYTFTLREFARLVSVADLAGLPPAPVGRGPGVVAAARRGRGLGQAVRPGDDDVPDPIDGGAESHRASALLVAGAVHRLVDGLAPRRPGRTPSAVRPPAAP